MSITHRFTSPKPPSTDPSIVGSVEWNDTHDYSGLIEGAGVVGQVAEFVTDTKTVQAAKLIAPASNILTLTNAAASTLALDISANKALTLKTNGNSVLSLLDLQEITFLLDLEGNVYTINFEGSSTFTFAPSVHANFRTSLNIAESTGIESIELTPIGGGFSSSIILENSGSVNLNYAFNGGGTLNLGGFTGTLPATGTFAIGAGTLSATSTNNVIGATHTHAITASPSLLGNGTSQYQTIITGGTPFAPAYSGFLLDGTTGGKTVFSVTNTKTLTLTATDNYGLTIAGTSTINGSLVGSMTGGGTVATGGFTLTVPATGTAALLARANLFTTVQKIQTNDGANTKLTLNIIVDAATWNIDLSFSWADVDKMFLSGYRTASGYFMAVRDVSGRFPWILQPSNGRMGVNYDNSSLTNIAQVTIQLNDVDKQGIVYISPWGAYSGYPTNALEIRVTDILGFGYDVGTVFIISDAGIITQNILTSTGNTVQEVAHFGIVNKTASTGGANGFGAALGIYAETATNNTIQQQASIYTAWIDATNASRKAKLTLSAYDTAERKGFEIEASGSAAKIGFYGVTPVVRSSAYTPTNVTTDRSYDANATTLDEVADVLGTLITDLQAVGLLA